MQGSWGSRLASLERSAAAEEEGRKGQIEGENRRRNLGAVYHGQVEKYFEKGGGGQIMNCREFTSFWMGRRRDKGIACNPCFDHPHAIPPTGIVSSDCIQPRGTKKLPH